jgi:hypothetical protein
MSSCKAVLSIAVPQPGRPSGAPESNSRKIVYQRSNILRTEPVGAATGRFPAHRFDATAFRRWRRRTLSCAGTRLACRSLSLNKEHIMAKQSHGIVQDERGQDQPSSKKAAHRNEPTVPKDA